MKVFRRGYWKKGHYISRSYTGFWSKYGGVRHGIVKQNLKEWFCQVCSEKQSLAFPSYMIKEDNITKEFVRVCSSCKFVSLHEKVSLFGDLVKLIRKPDGFVYQVANLMSLTHKI